MINIEIQYAHILAVVLRKLLESSDIFLFVGFIQLHSNIASK